MDGVGKSCASSRDASSAGRRTALIQRGARGKRRHGAEKPVISGPRSAVGALALVAAMLRFSTLGVQSFGEGELYTVWLIAAV